MSHGAAIIIVLWVMLRDPANREATADLMIMLIRLIGRLIALAFAFTITVIFFDRYVSLDRSLWWFTGAVVVVYLALRNTPAIIREIVAAVPERKRSTWTPPYPPGQRPKPIKDAPARRIEPTF
jgi:hypothetical protein